MALSDEQIDAVTLLQWGEMKGHPLAAHRAYARAIEAEVLKEQSAKMVDLERHLAEVQAELAAIRALEPVAWAEKAMELATDFGVCSLRLGSYERADVVFNAQKASWQTIDLRAKREDARERLRQHLFATPPTEAKPAKDAVDAAIPLDKDELAQLIAEHLGDTYHCTRVWEAWHVGTMSQDDFEPVDESETPTEIADAIIDAIRAAISAKKGG